MKHVILSTILIMCAAAMGWSDTWYVEVGGAGGGTDWTDTCSLQFALTSAGPGDQIWLKEGTYYPGTLRTDTFQLTANIELYGGFAGGESARTDRDFRANPTVLSGDIDINDTLDSNNVYTVVKAGNNSVLDGITVTMGYSDSTAFTDQNYGGGIYGDTETMAFRNCIIADNFAFWGGGAYFDNPSGPIEINNCLFA
ncbi:hypothetical protein ACFL4W_04890, partial [Planctomycetota bacterium]